LQKKSLVNFILKKYIFGYFWQRVKAVVPILVRLLRSAFQFETEAYLEFAIWPSCKCFSSLSVCTEYQSDRLNSNKTIL